jgi:hypothetical protein
LARRTYAVARASTTDSSRSSATAGTIGATAGVTIGAAVGVGLLVFVRRIFLVGGIGNGIFVIGRVRNNGVVAVITRVWNRIVASRRACSP